MDRCHRRSGLLVLGILLLATRLFASGQAPQISPLNEADRYRIRPGDSLELNFPFVSSFNQTVTVQPDGYISLRVLGDLRVEGQTVPELRQELRTRYASIMRDPVVTVELKDFVKPQFTVAGEVERPGRYDLRGDTTLVQGLAIAGGFKDRAKRTHVVVFRRGEHGPQPVQVQEIDARQMLEGKEIVNDVRLEPGDLVFVSKTHIPNMTTFMNSVLPNIGWLAYTLLNRP